MKFSGLVAAVASSAGHGEDAAPHEGHERWPKRESGRGPLDHHLHHAPPTHIPNAHRLRHRRGRSARPGANHSSRGHVTRSGTAVLSPNAWTAPVDVECPRPREPSAHAASLTRAARPARTGRERADCVHIGYKGSERTHTDERKPHDSAVHMDGQGALAVLCHRFGHSGPRSPPVRCQCALPSSTRSTPAMMSAMPATMVRVSGSLKRSLEAIAVTATPPADQIP